MDLRLNLRHQSSAPDRHAITSLINFWLLKIFFFIGQISDFELFNPKSLTGDNLHIFRGLYKITTFIDSYFLPTLAKILGILSRVNP